MDPTALVALIQSIPVIGPYAAWVPVVITIGSVIALKLPAPGPASGWLHQVVYDFVQWCALNKGKATNAIDPKATAPKT